VPEPSVLSSWSRWACLLCGLCLLATLAACGSHPTRHARTQYNPSRYYPPPGSRDDPWGPYIHEASGRFAVPELWIRRVMRQESGGQEDVISWAGAMGLMQVMPDTYDGLRGRYSLGDDPFDPHNNILAGTAYLREMYDRFGAPGFLAAYNAGPNRLDRYLNNGTPLPDETINYVASIAPALASTTAMSGPLAVYAGSGTRYAVQRTPGGCDPDAAYNPDGPCSPVSARVMTAAAPAVARPAVVAAVAPSYMPADCDPDAAYNPGGPCTKRRPAPEPAVAVAAAVPYAQANCDPDAAYDPTRPCKPVPVVPAVPEPVFAQPLPAPASQPAAAHAPQFASRGRPLQEMMGQPVTFVPSASPGHWAVQVGAFANLSSAQAAAENARKVAPDLLRMAKIELPATTPFGTQVAFRARLSGLSSAAAADACSRLSGRGLPCMTIAPERGSF
jgi:D-alanyl-D-alanine carboxypeptidase